MAFYHMLFTYTSSFVVLYIQSLADYPHNLRSSLTAYWFGSRMVLILTIYTY